MMGSVTFAARVGVRWKRFTGINAGIEAAVDAPGGRMTDAPSVTAGWRWPGSVAELTKSEMTLYAVLTHTSPKTKPLTANVSDMLRRRRTCSGHSEYAGLECLDMTILPFEPTN